MTGTEAFRIAELCRDEPFWELSLLPPPQTLLELIGNRVAVGSLPIQVRFTLHCVVCGQGEAEYAWEVVGPVGGAANGDTTVLGGTILSASQRIAVHPFGERVAGAIGAKTLRAVVAPMFESEGVYFIIVRLDGHVANRIPIVVTRYATNSG